MKKYHVTSHVYDWREKESIISKVGEFSTKEEAQAKVKELEAIPSLGGGYNPTYSIEEK